MDKPLCPDKLFAWTNRQFDLSGSTQFPTVGKAARRFSVSHGAIEMCVDTDDRMGLLVAVAVNGRIGKLETRDYMIEVYRD